MNTPDTTGRIDIALESSGISRRVMARALSALRWAILATILLITWLWPFPGRTGNNVWIFVLVFVVYNAVIELLRWRTRFFASFGRVALFDLPVASALFFLDYSPGGPLFVLFYLGLISAALTMSARGTIAYTAAIIVVVTVLTPTLPGWSSTGDGFRQLGARLATFALIGIGSALMAHRLVAEMQSSRRIQDEAFRLETLDLLRDEFVASVSHDLRTPLTAIRAGLGLFEMRAVDRLDPDDQLLLRTTRRNIDRLGLLVDDLLTYNQIEAGVLRIDRDPVEIVAVVNDAIATIDPLLVEKQQTLDVTLSRHLVAGDSNRLAQVFVNLLANANRHTPSGTHIAVTAERRSSEIVVTVSDDGPGIPVEQLPEIFNQFRHNSGVGSGSGLGLSIVRSIVELHGGRVWVVSSDDGTAFHVALPVAIAVKRGVTDNEIPDRR